MGKKYKFTFGLIALAFVAVIVGLCCVFFGNVDVHDVKVESLEVQTIDGDYLLVAKFNNKFDYRFTLEKFIEDDYYVVETVRTTSNILNLSKRDLNLEVGSKFRFSACYTTENQLNGKQSDYLLWAVSETVAIDYETVVYDETNIEWEAIEDAHFYHIIIVNSDGRISIRNNLSGTSFDVGSLELGNYRIYICSVFGGDDINFAKIGEGIEIAVKRTNLISDVEFDGQDITFVSIEDVESAEIYVEGVLMATATLEKVVGEDGVQCKIKNCGFVLSGVDFENQLVQIRTKETEFIHESNFLRI